jgi:hypothetical protein
LHLIMGGEVHQLFMETWIDYLVSVLCAIGHLPNNYIS